MYQISKSDYLKYRIHPAYLWYQKHAKAKLPKPSANDEYVFEQGHKFEALAQELFADAVNVNAEPWQYDELLDQTQRFIEREDVSTIFQASFMTQDRLFCKSDVVERTEEGWILSEIKSSTSVKQSHIYDVGFQRLVMEKLGYTVVACRVIHVNKFYKRKEAIKPESITAIRDITEQVEEIMPIVEREVAEAQSVVELAEVNDHPAYAGNLSAWLNIYGHIHKQTTSNDSIFNFAQLTPQQVRSFYEAGIEKIQDAEPTALKPKQQMQRAAWVEPNPIIDLPKIHTFMSSLEYPLYFLDYETSGHVLPLYDNTKPYQQVPFQYSLHVLQSPDSELEHYEFLHQELSLPASDLSAKLLSEIGSEGTIVAWFDKFEKYCNRTLGDLAPEYKDSLIEINERMTDLRIPFANYGYVHKLFNGSTSIKKVLPVLVPELSYKTLGIQEGGAAQRSWQQAVSGERPGEEQQIFDDLLEYCRLDTLAMVEIFRFLLTLLRDYKGDNSESLKQEALF